MKNILTSLLILAISSTAAFAQLPGASSLGLTPEKQTSLLMEQLGTKIEMSDDQVEKMTKVHKDFLVLPTRSWTAELLIK